MGILFIAEAVIDSDPAYRRRVLHLMREARGAAPVSLFVFGVAPPARRAELDAALEAAGIPSRRSIRLPAVPGLRALFFLGTLLAAWIYVGCRLRLGRHVRIVQVENLLAFLPPLPFARGPRRPAIVLDVHGAVPEEVRRKRPGTAPVLFPLLKRIERAALDRADALVVPSEGFRRHAAEVLGYPAERIVVVPNRPARNEIPRAAVEGTDRRGGKVVESWGMGHGREAVREGLGLAGRLVLVYAGGAAAYQEPGRMIDAFKALLGEEPRAFFLCLTTDPGRFEALFDAAGLPGQSRRVLRLAPEDVARHLRAGDAALLIRDDSLLNRVSSPTKFVEYLAAGLPVVTTPGAGDAAAIVERERLGRVVPEPVAAALARAALELLRLPAEDRAAMAVRCREAARRMAGEGAADLARLYSGLLMRDGAGG